MIRSGHRRLARSFNLCYRYTDDLIVFNNKKFLDYLKEIYPSQLTVEKANKSDHLADYLDLIFIIGSGGKLSTRLYDKRDDFDFHIVNFPFLSSNIPSGPSYGVYISQLIRYARCCSHYDDFRYCHKCLVDRLLSQGYKALRLEKSFKKFYGRYQDVIEKYRRSVNAMMKVKEVNRTANIAWSPAEQYPIYLAAGTAAQQLDATFSTSAALEVFQVNLGSHDLDMPVAGSIPVDLRFHKLIWTGHGMQTGECKSGVLIGGADNGNIFLWDANAIISGNVDNALVHHLAKHSGPVQALDINPFQPNLLASGASESEIFIWDLKNPSTNLTPGAKTMPPDNISCLSWNRQVQHILASASPSGRVVVWDLRKSEPIIKVGDQSAMMHCKAMAWHPETATQMLVGNEDDRYPVIQMWDLRFATSPMKVLEGHQRGILSLAWCSQDPDLLMSCGKDNRILCWNPNSQAAQGEIVYELPTSAQWSFDVNWCPRNPAVISTASFDGHVTLHSLMGTGAPPHTPQNQVADSFGTGDSFLGHQAQAVTAPPPEPLKKPPRWMRRPCGATFGFGGKLVSFGNFKDVPQKQVFVSQCVTELEFLQRSCDLENALLSGHFVEFCDRKIVACTNKTERSLWSFLKVNFDREPRLQFLDLLGYHPQELSKKISSMSLASREPITPSDDHGIDANELATKMQLLDTDPNVKADGGLFSSGTASPVPAGSKTPGSDTDATSAFDAIAAGQVGDTSLNASISGALPKRPGSPLSISTADTTDGLVSQALLTGNFEGAVDICIKAERMAEALILAVAGGPELFARTQERYLNQAKTAISKLITSVVGRDWRSIVETCVIENWKEALAALVTYGRSDEFFELCDLLGQRLENEGQDYSSAMVCYICSGNVERLVACWSMTVTDPSALSLQELIEKVMILKKAVEREKRQAPQTSNTCLAEQLSKYASILASQGTFQTAMVYLGTIDDESVAILKDRLFHAQAQGGATQAPLCPFHKVNVRGTPAPVQQMQQQVQPTKPQQPSPGFRYQPQPSPNTIQPTPSTSFYNPMAPATSGMYQPSQPFTSQTQTPMVPQPTYPGRSPSQQQPLTFPGQIQPQPGPPMEINPPIGNYYNPQGAGYGMAPPPGPPLSNSSMSQPSPPPPGPGQTAPISRKAAEQITQPPSAPSPNLFNPAVQPQPPSVTPTNIFNPATSQPQFPTPSQMPRGPGASSTIPPTFNPGQPVVPPHPKPEPEPVKKEVIKDPIPAEHMNLQQTFDAIVDRCRTAANNPQTKRKLDDVARRLDTLYDMLRDQRLSQNVLSGLHQMAGACQNMDYKSGYQIHTQMVVSGNFSEISSFMPGLKTLMQIASQLRV